MNEIQPSDVYGLVTYLSHVLYVMIGLLLVKIGITLWAWVDVHRMLKESQTISRRVEHLLKLATIHGEITDAQKVRVVSALEDIRKEARDTATVAASAVKEAASVVVERVEQVPDRVVEKIKEAEAGESGTGLTPLSNKIPKPPLRPSA